MMPRLTTAPRLKISKFRNFFTVSKFQQISMKGQEKNNYGTIDLSSGGDKRSLWPGTSMIIAASMLGTGTNIDLLHWNLSLDNLTRCFECPVCIGAVRMDHRVTRFDILGSRSNLFWLFIVGTLSRCAKCTRDG